MTLQDGLGAPESIAWGFHIRDPQRNSEEKCIVKTGMGTNISLNTIKYLGKLRIVQKILNSLSIIMIFDKSPYIFSVTC